MGMDTAIYFDPDDPDDDDYICVNCGNPVSVDHTCDCKGSEIDRLKPENMTRVHKVRTIYGPYRTTRPS